MESLGNISVSGSVLDGHLEQEVRTAGNISMSLKCHSISQELREIRKEPGEQPLLHGSLGKAWILNRFQGNALKLHHWRFRLDFGGKNLH